MRGSASGKKGRPATIIRTILAVFLFASLYIAVPFSLGALFHTAHPVRHLLVFYAAGSLLVIYSIKKYFSKKYLLEYRIQEIAEDLNVASAGLEDRMRNNLALADKRTRYSSLKQTIERVNASLDLERVAADLTASAFSAVSGNKGAALLYLADTPHQTLRLVKTQKQDTHLVVKAKEGDIFDFWVGRHVSPLLVEDVRNDFRFDVERLNAQDSRPVGSLISCPLVSNGRLIGILRLDSPATGVYSQDDLRFLSALSDIGAVALENAFLFAKMQNLAIHDGLTGLFTKGHFLERLKDLCRRSVAHNQPLSLLMLDIDFFKKYNDTFGHSAGDSILKKLGRLISGFFQEQGVVAARFGGEEFCIALPGIDKRRAYRMASEFCAQIAQDPLVLRRQQTHITVSIGLASAPGDAGDEISLIREADRALYDAKQEGRNRVCGI